MSQLARPTGDVSVAGTWVLVPPPPPPTIFSRINQSPTADTSYVTSPSAGGSFEVRLGASPDLVAPGPGSLTVTVRVQAAASGAPVEITLLQGSTPITRTTRTLTGTTFQNVLLTLTPTERALITDYTDLRVRVSNDFVLIPACPNPYPTTFTGTWTSNSGTCGCFTGSFPLTWDGAKWTGTFTGCAAGSVTVFLSISVNGFWAVSANSSAFNPLAVGIPLTSCGSPPDATFTIAGGCSGGAILSFS